MLWRRGAGIYRPVVPFIIDLDELEAGPDSDWERYELPQTHFEWVIDKAEEEDPSERIQETVTELWRIATAWTRQSGAWCDFQLVGYDEEGEVLFADGRRCRPPRAQPDWGAQQDASPQPKPIEVDLSGLREVFEQIDARKDKFIDRLASDRDWSFETAQQAMGSAPALIERAGEILKDTIAYQHKVVEQLHDRATGRVELRARAFAEMERSRRAGMAIELSRYFIDTAVGSFIPFANRIVEVFANREMIVFPEFKSAQQAMAYLVYSLKPSQLFRIFKGNKEAAGAALALLDDGSKLEIEKEALEYIEDLIIMLRSEIFEDVASLEEQLAARYIIGRYAMYRMNDYGEVH